MLDLEELMTLQNGVVSRRQLVARGWVDHHIARMVRGRHWARVHAGVYVNHTGELTWLQQAWAAVLFSWPAALTHQSALRAAEGPGRRDATQTPLHVVVASHRHLVEPPGVRLHRRRDAEASVQWNMSPPRVRYDQAAIDVAAEAPTEFDAIAVLARAVQSRRTTAARLRTTLASRDRTPRGTWLAQVLADIADGTCSVLEHGYLNRVERPHRLPRATWQRPGTGRVGRIYRDASYEQDMEIEIDGRLFHDTAEGRDRDFDRDLLAQVDGRLTSRLGWGQIFDRPCWTAEQVGRLLQQRGWEGAPTPCGPDCPLSG